jgi:hypothetical protein
MLAWRLTQTHRTPSVALSLCVALFVFFGCDEDKSRSLPAYYLHGRVYDAVSLDAVASAELSLNTGTSSLRVKSKKDGTFLIGPIAQGASYRISVVAAGMAPFEFTGLSLPLLDAGDDRTLIADIPLYQGTGSTPAFNIILSTGQATIAANATARFVPMAGGSDPALLGTLDDSSSSEAVSGHHVQALDGTLPNDASASASSYSAAFADGVAAIPEGALAWGTTYKVMIDPGPSFTPVTFALTPVVGDDIHVSLRRASASASASEDVQLPQGVQQYFTGRVYDGVSTARLTDYSLRLEYYDRVLAASISEDGRYVVGPLLPNADYSIVIEAPGHRSFLSHNPRIAATTSATPSLISFYFDAFLYPENVKAPAVQLRFSLQDDNALPSGTVRFAPRSGSILFDEDDETPAGVARQVWSNDEDLQQRTLVKPFTNGELKLAEGELGLGVTYEVSVYGVANYAVLENGSFRAGIDANPSFVLSPLAEPPLQVVAVSSDAAKPSPDGQVEIRFSQAIARYPRTAEATVLQGLNNGFSIDSPDKDGDAQGNVLASPPAPPAPIPASFRGVSYEITGDRLILKWNRAGALSATDADDPIVSVRYGGLGALQLYTATLPTSAPVTLASLLGTTFLDVQLVAQ